MSIFNELLPKILEISKSCSKNFDDDLKDALECLSKFEEDFQNERLQARDQGQKAKHQVTGLQSINEDDDETAKNTKLTTNEPVKNNKPDDKKTLCKTTDESTEVNIPNDRSSSGSDNENRRRSKKRSKNEVDGICSPEQDKRQKRNASVKAQSIISKQVNVNLTQKMRREESESTRSSRARRKQDDKENREPPPLTVQVKQEKMSIAPEPVEEETLPIVTDIKKEVDKDGFAMPAAMPIPKPRKLPAKEKSSSCSDDESNKRGKTRTQDPMPPPPVPSSRSTRASSRASSRATRNLEAEETPVEPRPKRTRAKKKASEASNEPEKDVTQMVQENGIASPSDKPRPKRTRKAQKTAEKTEEIAQETAQQVEIAAVEKMDIVKKERVSQPEASSPILTQKENKKTKPKPKGKDDKTKDNDKNANDENRNGADKNRNANDENRNGADKNRNANDENRNANDVNRNGADKNRNNDDTDVTDNVASQALDKTRVIENGEMNLTVTLDKTVSLQVEKHALMDSTVVLDSGRATIVLDKPSQNHNIMDATVILEKLDPKVCNMTADDSLLTDDSSEIEPRTPPQNTKQQAQPTSAVKEKVQQFEELASRVTRTKTRAMAKKEADPADNQTPPDKMIPQKPVLSLETLNKMNSMIFNGKPPQVSHSASKPRPQLVVASKVASSTSKLSSAARQREEAEDARRKKDAMLEAKREQQRRKREEKMAAAAAARLAAEQARRDNMLRQEQTRQEKQQLLDQGKLDKLKEVERKKQELSRKVAETEERRRQEQAARLQRLALEHKRADDNRRRQQEEQDNMKKEAALMAKEIEKRQREYSEKQKLKQRMENRLYHTPGKHHKMEPVYMCDGFQYLNSDEEEEPVQRRVPAWSQSKVYRPQLARQAQLPPSVVEALFPARRWAVDLRALFPDIDSRALARTSSAVWRTPPALPPRH